jgi:hypothetical protein
LAKFSIGGFDPFGTDVTKVMTTAQMVAVGGIGLAVFTAPSSNMLEQAAGAVTLGVAVWALAKQFIGGA